MSLNQLFEQLVGGQLTGNNQQQAAGEASAAGQQSSGLQGLSGIVDKIPGGAVGGLAAGGLLGVLVGNKKARKQVGKFAGGAVKVGGAALLGAVAYNAYKNWQSGKQPSATAPSDAQHAIAHADNQEFAKFDAAGMTGDDGNPFQMTLIKAMIAAANADGHIDRDEQKSIFDAVNKMDLEAEDKALVFDTLQSPPDIKEIASLSKGLEQASEIYLVSRMAIDPDHPSEMAYLDDLAMYLSIPDDLRPHLESQVEAAYA